MNAHVFRQWNWVDNGALPLLLALLRCCWWLPWLMLIQGILAPTEPGVVLPVWMLFLIPLVSLLLARLVAPPALEQGSMVRPDTAPPPPLLNRMGVALLGLVVVVLVLWFQFYRQQFGLLEGAWLVALGDSLIHWGSDAVPGAVIVGLFTVFMWLRGLLDASKRMAHDDVWTVFQVGLVALVLYLIFTAIGNVALTGRDGVLALTLLSSGMGALAVSSLKVTAGLDRALGSGQRTVASVPALSRSWLISTTTVIPLLLVAGVLLGALLAPEMVAALLTWLGDVARAVGRVVGQIALAIAYVLFMVAYYIARLLAPLIQRLFPDREVDPEQFLQEQRPENELEQLQEEVTAIPDTYRWIGLAIAIIIILVIFVIVIRRLRAAAQEEVDESRESILSADLLEAQLNNLWRNLKARFQRAAGALNPFLALDGEPDARRQIRSIYQQLLQSATDMGGARPPHNTPVEYETPLLRLLYAAGVDTAEPHVAHNLAIITERYYLARYGGAPPSVTDVREVEQAWEQLQIYMGLHNRDNHAQET